MNEKINNLKIIYFKMRALAETPQMLLHYAGIPYSYEMAWNYYKKPWIEAKSSVMFQQLPVLVVNDSIQISQSGSIVRYLSKLTNTAPKDELLLSQVDAIFETSQELFFPLNPTINFSVGDEFKQKKNHINNKNN